MVLQERFAGAQLRVLRHDLAATRPISSVIHAIDAGAQPFQLRGDLCDLAPHLRSAGR